MALQARTGPLILHLVVGLALIGLIIIASVAEDRGDNYAPIFLPAVVVVWTLVAVAIRLLTDAPKPLWLFSWLLALVWPPLAWAITGGAVTLLS